jgi:hypothetical protein
MPNCSCPPQDPPPTHLMRPAHPLDGDILAAHGAKVLTSTGSFGPDLATPTIYLPHWLLLPHRLLHETGFMEAFRRTLEGLHIRHTAYHQVHDDDEVVQVHLAPTEARDHPVDAWNVLQTLRAALPQHQLHLEEVGLHHLFRAATASLGTGAPGGMEGHGEPDHGLAAQGTSRLPVTSPQFAAPERLKSEHLDGRRRPVVAILDTGIGKHPWLPRTATDGPDAFVEFNATQPIPKEDPESGSSTTPVVNAPFVAGRLSGRLPTHAGHGTHLAGLVRQIAPNARVLPIRVMHGDGIVSEVAIIEALQMLVDRVDVAIRAKNPNPGQFVDIVLMAFAGSLENNDTGRTKFHELLRQLHDRGVILVAAAGNDASDALMYPAAFEEVHGVGALTSDGAMAMYTNDGKWVNFYAEGYAVVSCAPIDLDGHRAPTYQNPTHNRKSYDVDNFSSGLMCWSGTSFAAGIVASRIAAHLWNKNRRVPSHTDVKPAAGRPTAAAAAADGLVIGTGLHT